MIAFAMIIAVAGNNMFAKIYTFPQAQRRHKALLLLVLVF